MRDMGKEIDWAARVSVDCKRWQVSDNMIRRLSKQTVTGLFWRPAFCRAAALSLLIFSVAATTSHSAADDPLVAKVSLATPVLSRMQRDHKVSLSLEKNDGERLVHVHSTLADFDGPFTFTLGWFLMLPGKDGEVCVDECGERLPLPGGKPERRGFNKADLANLRGFDYVSAGKLKEALSEFESAAGLAPSMAKFHNNLGACRAARGDLAGAGSALARAVKIKPDYAVAHANLAWVMLARGEIETSLSESSAALNLDRALKPAVLAAGRAYLESGRPGEALAVADSAYSRWPDDVHVLILSGDAARERGDIRTAQKRFQKALVYGPNNPRALKRLAQTAYMLGDLDEALKRARAATQAAPDDAEAHLVLGRYLEMNRDSRAAQIQYERALELNADSKVRAATYGPLLRVLVNTNKYDEADRLSRQWIKDSPDSADCHYNRAWVAQQLPGAGMKAEAVSEYRRAVALNPALAQAHFNLAILLANQGKDGEAARELRSFIEKAPADPDVRQAKELLGKLERR